MSLKKILWSIAVSLKVIALHQAGPHWYQSVEEQMLREVENND